MKKNIVFFSLLCLFSMGVTSVKAAATPNRYREILSKITVLKTSVADHPIRTLGVLAGLSALGYVAYLYRSGKFSYKDVTTFFKKLCSCTKKVDAAKTK